MAARGPLSESERRCCMDIMNSRSPVLRIVNAVTASVPDLDQGQGQAFYRDRFGPELTWRDDGLGQTGLRRNRTSC